MEKWQTWFLLTLSGILVKSPEIPLQSNFWGNLAIAPKRFGFRRPERFQWNRFHSVFCIRKVFTSFMKPDPADCWQFPSLLLHLRDRDDGKVCKESERGEGEDEQAGRHPPLRTRLGPWCHLTDTHIPLTWKRLRDSGAVAAATTDSAREAAALHQSEGGGACTDPVGDRRCSRVGNNRRRQRHLGRATRRHPPDKSPRRRRCRGGRR
mmetsp:Transcript_22258/g.59186  ORF Transcript_22258/g.59186 Transcript_22258/m.59186 type:complete len:208 (-) Transcript_22258:302-925(-)